MNEDETLLNFLFLFEWDFEREINEMVILSSENEGSHKGKIFSMYDIFRKNNIIIMGWGGGFSLTEYVVMTFLSVIWFKQVFEMKTLYNFYSL